jgi:glutamate racemase
MLQRFFGRDVTLITSAEEIAREAAETVARRGVSNDRDREGSYRFMCTGDPAAFRDVAGRFLQLPLTEVEQVDPAALAVAA